MLSSFAFKFHLASLQLEREAEQLAAATAVVAAAIAEKEARDAAAAAVWMAAERARVRAVNAAEMARRVHEHKAGPADSAGARHVIG